MTPLATLHKFNGWADVFLNNGGPAGLRDAFVYFAPRLPWGLAGRIVYHRFENDDPGRSLGYEVDGVVQKKLCEGVTARVKAAWFNGRESSAPADRFRGWFEVVYAF